MKHPSPYSSRLRQWLSGACFAILIAATVSARGQSIGQTWEGIVSDNTSVPPDPHGAPGPAGVLATVNLRISYFSKAGAIIWGPTALGGTFFPANTGVGNQNSDPKVIFDQDSRRFFVIMQENQASTFWLNVAVSRTADPRTSGAADWIVYRLNATENAASNSAGGVNYGGDYPGLAVDSRALYVTYRMYGFTASGQLSGLGADYINTALLILNKNQLLNGPGTVVSLYQNVFGLQPVTPIPQSGTAGNNVMFMVNNSAANSITIYSVTDPLGARTVASRALTIVNRGNGVGAGAPQSGSVLTVPTIDRTMGNASLTGGDIWFCATRGTAGGRAVAAYYRVRLNGWPIGGSNPTLVEDNTVGNAAEWNFCPAIGVNLGGDAVITWTRSSSSIFPTIAYASRTSADASFGTPQTVTTSISRPPPLPPIGPTFNSDGRWGDYFSAWPDPNDGSIWITSEWTRADTGNWSTWWAQIAMPPRDSYVDLNGNAFFQNGSSVFPWLTVGLAHTTITSGIIHIAAGHYNEQITLNKSVTLQKNGGGGDVVIGAP